MCKDKSSHLHAFAGQSSVRNAGVPGGRMHTALLFSAFVEITDKKQKLTLSSDIRIGVENLDQGHFLGRLMLEIMPLVARLVHPIHGLSLMSHGDNVGLDEVVLFHGLCVADGKGPILDAMMD